ncbi:unnamed protein product [Thelazia callipaeda]|uniref:EB domain-containing protein n=1 Tax=Thelazia callipaeda TaxID=103827 RepID=A0A0N5D1V9_THECL|nr:unnamed protein product [Thelazia callipaeda]
MVSFAGSHWQCIYCYYPSNPYYFPYEYPYPYPYPYPVSPAIEPATHPSIGPCVNGQCPAGFSCYRSQCIRTPNVYGPCVNDRCPMGFCYNGQCVG